MKDSWIYIIIVIVCVALIAYFVLRDWFIKNDDNKQSYFPKKKTQNDIFEISFLPTSTSFDDNALAEIKDKKLLAKIDNIVPETARVAKNVNSIKKGNELICKVIIPKEAKLVNSKDMDGAFRGIYRNSKRIKGQANLVPIEKSSELANVASSAFNVASMVVGQYYMAQIDNELSNISDSIEKISDFQNTEYKGKIMALVTQIRKISAYEIEVLDNEQLRKDELQNVSRLEHKCLELLGQANLYLEEKSKNIDEDYEQYEKKVKEARSWYFYQNILLDTLYRISELKHALYKGEVSREYCCANNATYAKQVADVQDKLISWHKKSTKKFRIQISRKRIKRSGLDGAVHSIPGFFDEKHNYKKLPNDVVEIIKEQTNKSSIATNNDDDLYKKDVCLIMKDSKVYYLPESKV